MRDWTEPYLAHHSDSAAVYDSTDCFRGPLFVHTSDGRHNIRFRPHVALNEDDKALQLHFDAFSEFDVHIQHSDVSSALDELMHYPRCA